MPRATHAPCHPCAGTHRRLAAAAGWPQRPAGAADAAHRLGAAGGAGGGPTRRAGRAAEVSAAAAGARAAAPAVVPGLGPGDGRGVGGAAVVPARRGGGAARRRAGSLDDQLTACLQIRHTARHRPWHAAMLCRARRAATLLGRTERPDPDCPPHRTSCSSPTSTARWPTTWATCCTSTAAPARRSWTPGSVPCIASTARADPGSPTGGPERKRGWAIVGQ